MKKAGAGLLLLFCLSAAAVPASFQGTAKDQAVQAFRSGQFRKAVRLCREALGGGREDEEVRFILSRALAYGRNYFEALEALNPLLNAGPKNTDYLLLWARIEFWQGNVAASAAVFDEVLKIAPGHPEALGGKGRLAAARNDYPEAERLFRESLAADPRSAEIHYALGLLFRWQGEYEKARDSFLVARDLDPTNPDYKKALTRIPGRSEANHEIRLIYQPETFSDGRTPFQNGQAALFWRLPKNGPALIFKGDRTRRYGLEDSQFGMEIYPHLWKGASAYVDLNYSPGGASLYPESSGLIELYQALTGSWDVSLGCRYMKFASEKVFVTFGFFGAYVGPFYSTLRIYYSPKSTESKVSWIFLSRWYFADRNYLYGGYGRGSRSVEIVSTEELNLQDVRTMLAGIDVTVFRNLHVLGSYARLTDRGVTRNTLTVGLGYKWGK